MYIAKRPAEREDDVRDGAAQGTLTLHLEERLDLDQLWRLRSLLWPRYGRLAELDVDCGRVRRLEPDAAFLLYEDLRCMELAGATVRLRGLGRRLRRSLRCHPLLGFERDGDELFTDPDLEITGFRPSRH